MTGSNFCFGRNRRRNIDHCIIKLLTTLDMLTILYESGFYESVNESYFMDRLNSIADVVGRNNSQQNHFKSILEKAYSDENESWFAKTIQAMNCFS